MGLADNLNFLTTIGTFGCISFALSGFGVKLGKFSSYPHQLGFSYISEKEEQKQQKLYDAIAKTSANNKEDNANIPSWAKDAGMLKKWCKDNEKSPMKWKEASQYCLVKPNVWHHLILNDVNIEEETLKKAAEGLGAETAAPSVPSTEVASPVKVEEKCTYKLLNMYADSENHVDYLIGRRACGPKVNIVPTPPPQAPVPSGGGASTSTQST